MPLLQTSQFLKPHRGLTPNPREQDFLPTSSQSRCCCSPVWSRRPPKPLCPLLLSMLASPALSAGIIEGNIPDDGNFGIRFLQGRCLDGTPSCRRGLGRLWGRSTLYRVLCSACPVRGHRKWTGEAGVFLKASPQGWACQLSDLVAQESCSPVVASEGGTAALQHLQNQP